MAPMMISTTPSEGSFIPSLDLNEDAGYAEPIAICGFACRLPGDSSSPEKLWNLISEGRSCQCDVPKSRFNVDAFYHPNGTDRPGSMITRGGYFLNEDIRHFENSFFGINNLEATYMDPQQRKLLEVVFECFESAGVTLEKAAGSNTGCYVGNFTVDYQIMQTRDSDYLSRYSATGMGTTILSNRISHVFDLCGPSMVLDTACSSSLYCLHVACVALQHGECDSAIVAGANLVQSAEQHLGTMKAGVLSPTSTCHTFDASADGYGRADGIGALYVKRLSDAIRENDTIRSVVRSSAINANGKTAGISLPSADGQEAVIRKAYAKAGISPAETTYVECHGTGTKVGDAIEVEALSRVFCRTAEKPLIIGSVKSNVGHSEAASGISSIIKASLVLEKGAIPPTHGLKNINPKLKIQERNISIPTELTPWPRDTPIRRVGVNSFGYGGANSHVILEAAVDHVSQLTAAEAHMRQMLGNQHLMCIPVSAESEASLDARVGDLISFDFKDTELKDLAYTLSLRRSHLTSRGFILASSRKGIVQNFAEQTLRTIATTPSTAPVPFTFVFTGQGAQWAGMCRELFELRTFKQAIAEMDHVLSTIPNGPDWSLAEAIINIEDPDLIQRPERSQPCCTAIQVALVQLLATWGISPAAVIGHSSGEIAAAFAAGYISSAEAIVLAYYRGYAVSRNPQQGAMIAVGLSQEEASAKIDELSLAGKVQVACVNSPESVTVSGNIDAIDSLLNELQRDKIFARKLKTGGQAYHSRHMHALGNEYQELIDRAITELDTSVRMPQYALFISSVNLEPKSSGFNSSYWRSNLESPVLFAPALEQLAKVDDYHYVEVGPHSALELPIKQTLINAGISSANIKYSSPTKRGHNSLEIALNFAGYLWLRGFKVDWLHVNGLNSASKGQRSLLRVIPNLPTYKFKPNALLWNECRASSEYRHRKFPRHELLGSLIPGGNGRELMFRNVLRVGDVAWLRDHRLEETVVFPGTGYIAMAMEAVMQGSNIPVKESPSFEISNVHILNALVLSTEPGSQVEMFTTLYKTPITNASPSGKWWDFSITSYQKKAAINHARGSISIHESLSSASASNLAKYEPPESSLERNAPRVWYEKLMKQGLNYGSEFQSISEFQTSRSKTLPFCKTTTTLLQESGDKFSVYPVHPITLDAMLQAAIVATSCGNPKDLRAKVPNRFGMIRIKTPSDPNNICTINTSALRVGFGAAEIGAELLNNGEVLVQFDQVRLAPYEVVDQLDVVDTRHPILRVLWKPDFDFLSVPVALEYIRKFIDEANSPVADPGLLGVGAMIDLLVHKNPRVTICELGNGIHDITTAILDLLASQSDFTRFSSYTCASFLEDGTLSGGTVNLEIGERVAATTLTNKYDVVIVPIAGHWVETKLDLMKEILSDDGILLMLCPENVGVEASVKAGLSTMTIPITEHASIIVARKIQSFDLSDYLENSKMLIVERASIRSPLGSAILEVITHVGNSAVKRLALESITLEDIPVGTIVINLCEVQAPLLATSTDFEMHQVKLLTDNAAQMIWITNGDIKKGGRPDFSLVSGLSRALVLEQPSLQFFTFDIDSTEENAEQTARNLVFVLNQQGKFRDLEFAQQEGVVHVSRFVPDDGLNDTFRIKQGHEIRELSLKEAGDVRLNINQPGQFDTLCFKQQEDNAKLHSQQIRIRVAAVGLNAKDFYALAGKVDTKDATCSLECAGTVEAVGNQVEGFAVGDRVVAMAPSHFQTYQNLPSWACHRLEESQDFNTVCTLPVVYSTAIYALHHRAHIREGESVLIHSGTGGVGMASIHVSKAAGAEIFTTVSNDTKKQYLVDHFGIKPENIFSSHDTAFKDGILKATGGRGVDVVINSLTGDQLHATWKCCAQFGRFVEIGKLDLSTAGRLDMDQFLKNATFTAFDLSSLYNTDSGSHHRLWKQLLSQVMDLFREDKIKKIEPLRVFDMSDITQAFRHLSSRSRMGKIAVNLENRESKIPVQPSKYRSQFSPSKSYVMVGCLGGLGRTMSRWMLQRGARKFVFLGRSGLDKMAARSLVEDLEASGAECIVVKGDVCSRVDVDAVVAAAPGDIGGVVQAAMDLSESLFTTMSNANWHRGIAPKVRGTWNLHNSIRASGRDTALDFFLMTSSISGSVGTATESNYCAGNHFLDQFARYRRSFGLPAVSVGLGMISEVGYLHENPEIEALLLRKGIQAIDQDELLQIIDLSLDSTTNSRIQIHHAYDTNAVGHVLTGLEPFGLKELRKRGFEGNNPTLADPRAALLAAALDRQSDTSRHSQEGNLPKEVLEDMEAGKSLEGAILAHIRWRFGNLVLMKMEAVDVKKALAEYGMDSMIAAEFRTWFYQALKVDIPFLALLSKATTLETLTAMVMVDVKAATETNSRSVFFLR